jgi:hypothetical protein
VIARKRRTGLSVGTAPTECLYIERRCAANTHRWRVLRDRESRQRSGARKLIRGERTTTAGCATARASLGAVDSYTPRTRGSGIRGRSEADVVVPNAVYNEYFRVVFVHPVDGCCGRPHCCAVLVEKAYLKSHPVIARVDDLPADHARIKGITITVASKHHEAPCHDESYSSASPETSSNHRLSSWRAAETGACIVWCGQ